MALLDDMKTCGAVKRTGRQLRPLRRLPCLYQSLLIEAGMSNPDAAIFTKHVWREQHTHVKTLGC